MGPLKPRREEQLAVRGAFRIVPLDFDIAREIVVFGNTLRDPGDRPVVATARVDGLRLVTSDQRIIESKLVPVVE